MAFLHPLLSMVLRPAQRPGIDMNGRATVHEDIVLDLTTAPASNEGRPRYTVEQIADNLGPAEHVVQIDAHTPLALEAGDIMEEIMPDNRAAHGPISSGIDRAGIVRFEADAVNLVELDEMVIAAERDRLMRRIINQVVGGALADPI